MKYYFKATIYCLLENYNSYHDYISFMAEKVIYNKKHQLPLTLTALLHTDLINVVYLTTCVFIRS